MKAFLAGTLFVLAVISLPVAASDSSVPPAERTNAQRAEIEKRLNSIIIDKFTAYLAPLGPEDIKRDLTYLTKRSKELDPAHHGVKFWLREPQIEAKTPPLPNAPGPLHRMAENWSDVPLHDLLDYICQVGGLTYDIENGEVVLFRAPQKASSH